MGRQGRGEGRGPQSVAIPGGTPLNTVLQSAVKGRRCQREVQKGGGWDFTQGGTSPSMRPGVPAKMLESKPSRERGGVPKGGVLAIASKVGLEEGSLGTSKEGSNLQLNC